MGKDFSPGPLARKVQGSKLRQSMDRARDAAPLAIEQIQRRLGRAVATNKGTLRKEVIRENAELMLRAARELREGVTDLSVGDLMVKSEWQKLDAKTKQAYLDYISKNQPGNTPEVRAANGEAAVAMFNEVMDSPMPEGIDLSQQAAPDRLVPAVDGGRKMVALGSKEAEERSRNAIPENKRASTIVGTAAAEKMRKRVADPAPVDREGALPSEVEQQMFRVAQAEQEGKKPVTRLTTEKDLKAQEKATSRDLSRAKKISELRDELAAQIEADIEGRAEFLGGTEPGLDVVPGQYASAGQVPVAPIDAPQQVRESMREIDTQGDQVFRDVADPNMRDLTPQQRRAYIQQMDPMPPMTPEQLAPAMQAAQAQMPLLADQIPGNPDLLLGRAGRSVPGLQGAVRSELTPTQLNLDMLAPSVLGGQPDAPGVRVQEGQVPGGLSVSPRIASLVDEISRLETPGAQKFLADKLARIREQMKPGAKSDEFLVKPFSENTRDIYNVLEFSDAPQERFNRYVMQMLDIPAEALYGLGRADAGTGMDPSGAKAIMDRAMERGGFTTPRKTPQRREVVPFDLDFVLPELTNSNWEMSLKATDSYTPENIAYLVADKMRLGPQQFEIVAAQLIPRVEQAMRARDDARRVASDPPLASGLPSARQSPPPPFGEMVPRQQQLDEYRLAEFTDQPLFAPIARPFEPRPGFDTGNLGAYSDKGRSPQTPGYVGILNRDELQALDQRLIAMADEALQGGEGTIQSIAPNQYGVFLPESQTPVRIINAEDIAKQIYDERDSALLDVGTRAKAFGLDAEAMDANAALSQLSDELGGLDYDGVLAEPASRLEDIGSQSVVESAPMMDDAADLGAAELDNAEDLVGTGVSMDELAPAAPPIGEAPSAAEVAQAVDNDGVLTFTQPPATASVNEAMAAIAGQATPEQQAAVQELIAAGQPINADAVAQATGGSTDVIRALAQQSAATKPKSLKRLEAEARGLRKDLKDAQKRGDTASVAAIEQAVKAKDAEVLAAVQASTTGASDLAPAAGPLPTTTTATNPAPAPRPAPSAPGSPAPAPAAGGQRRSAPPAPSPAPATAPAPAPSPMSYEDYLTMGRQLGFDPPIFGQNMNDLFGDTAFYSGDPVLEPADPLDSLRSVTPDQFREVFGGDGSAPTPPPRTYLNLPGRMLSGSLQYAKEHPVKTLGLGAAGTISAMGLANANRTPEPQAEPLGLTDEEQRLLQDYDAKRGSTMQSSQQPTLNPQQPQRSVDRLRMLLQPRP